MNNFEIKKKIVLAGDSRIFKDWEAHSTITMDDFISALQWLCEDALDGNGKLTREIALAPDLGSLWNGEKFPDGFIRKISVSAKDRI